MTASRNVAPPCAPDFFRSLRFSGALFGVGIGAWAVVSYLIYTIL